MDANRFDRVTRQAAHALSRRRTIKAAVASAVATALAGGRPGWGRAACLSIGARCGRRDQPACKTCCTGYTYRQPKTGQRRSTCRPDFKRCSRPDQCCSGVCQRVRCEGIDEPICLPGLFQDPC